MSLTIEVINLERERIISANFTLASEQLSNEVKIDVFKNTFEITAGCTTLEMTQELVKRFTSNGMTAKLITTTGFYSKTYSLQVSVPLPENLRKEEIATIECNCTSD